MNEGRSEDSRQEPSGHDDGAHRHADHLDRVDAVLVLLELVSGIVEGRLHTQHKQATPQ